MFRVLARGAEGGAQYKRERWGDFCALGFRVWRGRNC